METCCEGHDEQATLTYQEKRKADTRERVRRCRARKRAILDADRDKEQELNDQLLVQSRTVDRVTLDKNARQAQRVSAAVSRKIAVFAAEELQGLDPSVQNEIILKVLGHPLLESAVPSLLKNLEVLKQNQIIIDNMKSGNTTHLSGSKQSHLVMAKDILCTLASSDTIQSSTAAAKDLGLDRRNFRKALMRRQLLDLKNMAFWASYKRSTRCDSITEDIRVLVVEWWTNETQISPNRKDIKRRLIGVKDYEKHQTHFLQVSQLEFYTNFVSKHPSIKIGFTKFHSLKPWFVRRLDKWNTCCCRYHTELRYLMDAVNDMRSDAHGVHESCTCLCSDICAQGCKPDGSGCVSSTASFTGLTQFWSWVLYEKEATEEWHKMSCLDGRCSNCGVDLLLRLCPIELTSSKLVKWRCFGKEVVGIKENGQERKMTIVEHKETTSRELIDFLKPKISFFIKHNFLARWQDEEFRNQLQSMPANTMLTCVDFSKNYTMKIQNEIQTMHWMSKQVTILVMITYRVNPAYDPLKHESNLLKDSHYYISDDSTHDSGFVQHAFLQHWDFVKSKGRFPLHHIVWSDGCAAQFKCAKAWYFIARYPKLTSFTGLPTGCSLTWNYFASGHGKGEVDGAGALCKREIRKEQVKPNPHQLWNASQVVAYLRTESLKKHVAYANARRRVNKHFWLVGKSQIMHEKTLDAKTIDGSRSMHQVRSMGHRDPTLLQYRELSCSCIACIDRSTSLACEKSSHVTEFSLTRLQPTNCREVREAMYDSDEEIEAGTGGEAMAEVVQAGENVAIKSNDDSDPFWLMLVDKPWTIVSEPFTDGWNSTFNAGEVVIRGFWYERLHPGSRTYKLLLDKPAAYVLSHLVISSKFSMPPTAHLVKGSLPSYELMEEALDIISTALEQVRLLDGEED